MPPTPDPPDAAKRPDTDLDGASEEPFDPEEPVVLPIEEAIDLHHFHPSEVRDVVDAYIEAAQERGFREVRLIHGKGRGVQRANVQKWLARDPRVERFEDAPPGRGGWGATLAWLRPLEDGEGSD